MNDFAPLLVWPQFVYELQMLLRNKSPQIPLYLVGGSVRAAYLRADITDVDIAVDGDALRMARQMADWLDANLYVMDRERGVARVIIERDAKTILVDFAQFRGSTLEDDLRDRDFTINAMAVDLMGDLSKLIDPLNGVTDLQKKVLRLCADNAITADPIRALRAVRLSAQLGLKIHPDALSRIRSHGIGMRSTSPERVRDEFFKLLGLDNPARALRILQRIELLTHCISGIDDPADAAQAATGRSVDLDHSLQVVRRMSAILTAISSKRTDNTAATFDLGTLVMQLDRFRAQLQVHIAQVYGNGRRHRELLVLAALLHDLDKAESLAEDAHHSAPAAQAIARRMRLSNDEEKRLGVMIGNFHLVEDKADWSNLERHRFWFKLGESGIDAVFLATANFLGTHGIELDQRAWLRVVENATILLDTWYSFREELVYPILHLNGDDIMDLLQIDRGPAVGKLLKTLREAQVSGQVSSAAEAREFVARISESLS